MNGAGFEYEQLTRQRLERAALDAQHTPRLPPRSRSLRRHTAASLRRVASLLDG